MDCHVITWKSYQQLRVYTKTSKLVWYNLLPLLEEQRLHASQHLTRCNIVLSAVPAEHDYSASQSHLAYLQGTLLCCVDLPDQFTASLGIFASCSLQCKCTLGN